jgi:hypothetical protein
MTDQKSTESKTPNLGELDSLLESYMAKPSQELTDSIVKKLGVSNKGKYVRVGKWGVCFSHSHWGNDFILVEPWVESLLSITEGDR